MLQLIQIEKKYGEHSSLYDINLSIGRGEIFGLIGQEGAGKTTLFKIAAGLLRPDKGMVLLGGEPTHTGPERTKLEVGYVPSAFRLYDKLTVKEYMEFYAGFYPLEGLKKDRWIREILSQMELLEMEDVFVEKLSLGMSRRLCVAQALLSDPQVLILDETGNGLDARARQEFRRLLKKLSQTNRTILISSHNISDLPDYCTSVGILDGGRMIMQGSMEQVLQDIKKRQPLFIRLVSGQDKALEILKKNEMVKRITLLDSGILAQFDGEEQEEAELLQALVQAGAGVLSFHRDDTYFEKSVLNMISGQGE
ncbi:MAG: ABC transporter ATP-binding protein [Lachnospiraceae bacterium]|nr:ABC transporter ATP-binding protein [Lachnospiraceae bacterium]